MSVVTGKDELVVGPELAGTYMTPEEFDAAEDWEEGYCYELINGVLIVTPPAGAGERGPNDLLGQLLRNYQEQHLLGSSLNYTLTEHTIRTGRNRRRVDRVVWAGLSRFPNVRRKMPTIGIEFVASRRRDRVRDYQTKRREYGKAGMKEYWVVDRFRRRMTVFRYQRGKATEIVIAEGQVYTTPLLPGFELSIARLFAEADLLEPKRR